MDAEHIFDNPPFPLHEISVTSIKELFNVFPGLERYFSTVGKGDIPMPVEALKFIKYVFFLYHPDSKLTGEYPDDLQLRKEAAAKAAKFNRGGEGEWPEDLQRAMNFGFPVINRLILDFLKVCKNPDWTEMKIIEQEIDSMNRLRVEHTNDPSKVKDLPEQTVKRRDRFDILQKKFFADHSDLKNATVEELFPISPENVFKELEKEMEIPLHLKSVSQIKDVDKNTRQLKALN